MCTFKSSFLDPPNLINFLNTRERMQLVSCQSRTYVIMSFRADKQTEFLARRFDIEDNRWTDKDSKFRATFRASGKGTRSQNQGPDFDASCARESDSRVISHVTKEEKSAREAAYAWPRVRFYRVVAFFTVYRVGKRRLFAYFPIACIFFRTRIHESFFDFRHPHETVIQLYIINNRLTIRLYIKFPYILYIHIFILYINI